MAGSADNHDLAISSIKFKGAAMSRMCKMNISCQAARGMCIHQKMMIGTNHYCPRCLGLLAAGLSKQAMPRVG